MRNGKCTLALKDWSFLLIEMIKTAALLCEGSGREEIVRLSLYENVYQLNREKRKRDLPLYLFKRIDKLSPKMISILAYDKTETAKIINILSIIKTDFLFYSFIKEVYHEKLILEQSIIDDSDMTTFMQSMSEVNGDVLKWSDGSVKSIKASIKKILVDADLAKKAKNGIIISRPIYNEKIVEVAKCNGDLKYLLFLGMEV